MTLTWEMFITGAAVLAVVTSVSALVYKLVMWISEQRDQSKEIALMKEEQTLLTYGVLACLKGLREQGCDGPVTQAIEKIEKHINIRAHK